MIEFFRKGLDWRAAIVIGILLFVAIVIPTSASSPDSPFYLSQNTIILVGKYLCFALLALSVGLVWGYGGILSLGHGAFFALGGYAMGMYLMRQIGSRGVYGDPILPDFMVFLNWDELPWFWYGFDQFWFAAIMVFLVPGLLAFLFGWFAFRSRVTGVYLSIITQAMTFALWQAFLLNDFGFGGNNGFTDFKDILGANVQATSTRAAIFAASAIALAVGYWISRSVVASKYGKVLVAVRDAESRTRFLGYRADRYKLFVFTLSACLAGLAGALYVPQAGIINPSEFSPLKSIEVVVWVAVGGRGTLVGPIVGGILTNGLKSYFTGGAVMAAWLLALIPLLGLLAYAWFKRAEGWARSPLIGAAVGAAVAALIFVMQALGANTAVEGQATVTGGDRIVVGTDTQFTTEFEPGDTLITTRNGASYEIAEVTDDAHLTLVVPAISSVRNSALETATGFQQVMASFAGWWGFAVAGIALAIWLFTAVQSASGGNVYAGGATLGALIVLALSDPGAQLAMAEYWLFVLGGLFVAVTVLLPRGIVGTIGYGWNALRARRESVRYEEGRDADLTSPEPIMSKDEKTVESEAPADAVPEMGGADGKRV